MAAPPVAILSLPPHLSPSRCLVSNTIEDIAALGPPKHDSVNIPELRKKNPKAIRNEQLLGNPNKVSVVTQVSEVVLLQLREHNCLLLGCL